MNNTARPAIGIVGYGTVGKALQAAFDLRCDVRISDPQLGTQSLSLEALVSSCRIIFLAVPTPAKIDGNADLTAFHEVIDGLQWASGKSPGCYPVICVKSAVPPDAVAQALARHPTLRLVVSPEFLREASPIEDMLSMRSLVLGISIGSIIPLAPTLFSARKPIAIRFAGLDLCLLYNLKTMNNRVVEDEILHRYCSRVLGYLHRLKQRIALGIVEKIIKFCAKTGKCYIVTLSNTMRKLVELLNYSMSKITLTIPNFVDDVFFTVASKRFSCTTNYDRRKDRRKIMITYLGRLEYEKGADILAKIVKNVLDVCNNCLFKIVGDGRYRWMFENIRIRYGSRLIVTGFIPYNRVPQHLLESDIFVFPTRVEGSPNALLQAMASGLPIVASDIPPNREFLGEAGLYATPEKPEEFVHYILELVSNPDLRIRLGKKANERAKMYSREVIVQRYISLFRFLTRC
ncbi:MAG TPA: glycosyltransferase [Piscirickettsiaceae bacterium]|nr:glycosyltransferase [Piscirickettsiaceae bacterium]